MENAYRQAAIVVASLDRNIADDLLERMTPEQAQTIRDEIIRLQGLTSIEQGQVISEFLDQTKAGSSVFTVDDVIGEQEACSIHESDHFTAPVGPVPTRVPSSSIEELLNYKDEQIAVTLRCERPSVVACLLQALPDVRAASVLKLLPSTCQSQVVSLLAHGIRAPDQLVEIIADTICEEHARLTVRERQLNEHQDALQAILNQFERDEQLAMLDSLAKENPLLAKRLVAQQPAINSESNDCYC